VKSRADAYSYIRFSTPEQAKGDSLRRQTEAAKSWCQRHGALLDTSLTFRDLGRSAFLGAHRTNPDRYALAAFLKLVQEGRIARGSHLIIESLDRLTREHVRAGLMLLLGLIESGIRIVQLSPTELVYDEKSDEMQLMLAIVELSRGHRESKRKSDLQSATWADKRRKAREDGTVLTRRFPAWVEERDGRLRLIRDRAAVVRRIFKLAAAGYGHKMTVGVLIREGVPSFGPAGHWNASYVGAILKDRRAVGEFQPRRRRDRKPEGPPIADYYPAAVTEEEFYAARAGAAQRRNKRGRAGSHINVFAGLLKNALAGDSYYCAVRVPPRGSSLRPIVMINSGGHEGRVPTRTFPFATFEPAMLSMLAEVDPREVLGSDDGPDEVLALTGELAGVRAKKEEIEAELLNGDVAALAKVLRQLEARERDL
jgi:DNA invertase Pin-like site-specific DNA recombinase